MPSFGHLLTADARQLAPKRRTWEVILESDVHDSLADRTCRLCGAKSLRQQGYRAAQSLQVVARLQGFTDCKLLKAFFKY
jgi:hypothetical protein